MSTINSFRRDTNTDENRTRILRGVSEIRVNNLAEIQYKLQIDHLQKTSRMRRQIRQMLMRYRTATKKIDAMNWELTDLALQLCMLKVAAKVREDEIAYYEKIVRDVRIKNFESHLIGNSHKLTILENAKDDPSEYESVKNKLAKRQQNSKM
ncbi:DgyrCDS6287 [Dimorphilus gyrociliatus]|uniref:DgyrCDS6287 n=1 Tax=Dimorphilus gyrociliatus TaxID=2664684 RepID=A0A7I8VSE4_9ANNE|nr:DgyrCDS6287 [Dimorphilus gyrociliatus]